MTTGDFDEPAGAPARTTMDMQRTSFWHLPNQAIDRRLLDELFSGKERFRRRKSSLLAEVFNFSLLKFFEVLARGLFVLIHDLGGRRRSVRVGLNQIFTSREVLLLFRGH